MTDRWAPWIRDAMSPSADELRRVSEPVDPEVMKLVSELTAPSGREVQRLLAGRESYLRADRRQRLAYRVGGSMVALAATAMLVTTLISADPARPEIQVAMGEEVWISASEAMALGPDIQVTGSALIRVDQSGLEGTVVQVLEGTARFVVTPGLATIVVNVGDLSFRGFGTFEVVREATTTSVQVEQGELVGREDGVEVRLTSGSLQRYQPGELARQARAAEVAEVAALDEGADAAALDEVPLVEAEAPVVPPAAEAPVVPLVAEAPVVVARSKAPEVVKEPASVDVLRPSDIDTPSPDPDAKAHSIAPDTVAWLALQDRMDARSSRGVLLQDLQVFISTYPSSVYRDEADYYRLFYQASGGRPGPVAGEIHRYLRLHGGGARDRDLRYLLATLYRDRMQDCVQALPLYQRVANSADDALGHKSLAWWGLCARASGRPEARVVLTRASKVSLPAELEEEVLRALE